MTKVTVSVPNDNDISFLKEVLDRFGLTYEVEADEEYILSAKDINSFVKTRQDFLDGKTTARDWTDIEEDLNSAFN